MINSRAWVQGPISQTDYDLIIGSGDYTQFPPQPPGSLVIWGTEWPEISMTRTSPLLQDHTEYTANGMDVRNSMQLTEVVKLGPHRWPNLALCFFSN